MDEELTSIETLAEPSVTVKTTQATCSPSRASRCAATSSSRNVPPTIRRSARTQAATGLGQATALPFVAPPRTVSVA